jgi:hypothetical protein
MAGAISNCYDPDELRSPPLPRLGRLRFRHGTCMGGRWWRGGGTKQNRKIIAGPERVCPSVLPAERRSQYRSPAMLRPKPTDSANCSAAGPSRIASPRAISVFDAKSPKTRLKSSRP